MQSSRPYPSDLSDARWELIRPTLEAWRQARNGIRKPTHDLRALMNAILYVDRTGGWSMAQRVTTVSCRVVAMTWKTSARSSSDRQPLEKP